MAVRDWVDCSEEYDTLTKEIQQYNKDYNNELPFYKNNHHYWSENTNYTITKSMVGDGAKSDEVYDYVVNFLREKTVPSNLDGTFEVFAADAAQSLSSTKSSNAALIFYTLGDPFGIGVKINKMLSDINAELNEATRNVVLEREYATETLVGFDYTIGNVYRMLFAHMEVFVTAFYNMLNNAWLNKDRRTLKELNISVEQTDLPENWDVNNPIPPFTYFYEVFNENGGVNDSNASKENNKTRPPKKRLAWPNVSISETIFIEKMIMAAVAFGQEEKRINALIAKLNETGKTEDDTYSSGPSYNYGNAVTAPSQYIAITPHDFATNDDAPYEYLHSSHIQPNYFYQYVFVTFANRMFYFCTKSMGLNEQSGTQIDSKLFSKIEADNFRKSHPKLTPEIQTLLDKKEDEYLSFITTRHNGFVDKSFSGPVLSKKGDVGYEYTMYESSEDSTVQYFPISITDPTDININVYNKNSFARLNGLTEDDDYWKFVSAEDVLLPYSKKADSAQYNALIGNTNLPSDSSYNYKKPSIIYDITTKDNYFIYGHSFFYNQNLKKEDTERIFAKAYMFVMGLDRNIPLSVFKSDGFHPYMIPFEMILLVGAARYRMDYMNEHDDVDLIVLYDTYKHADKNELYMRHPINKQANKDTLDKYNPNISTRPGFVALKNDSQNNGEEYFCLDDFVGEMYKLNSKFAEQAKEFFVNWVNNSFTTINNYLEIYQDTGDSTSCPYDGNSFKEFVGNVSETT